MADDKAAEPSDRLLKPSEVAALFRVDPKTVTRWASAGRISRIKTVGGHNRFRESEVRALLENEMTRSPAASPIVNADGEIDIDAMVAQLMPKQ